MTSSNRNISALLALCAGNSPVAGEFPFPSQRPVSRSFDVFFDLRLKKNGWVNNRDAGGLRRHRAHIDVTVINMSCDTTIGDFQWSLLGRHCFKWWFGANREQAITWLDVDCNLGQYVVTSAYGVTRPQLVNIDCSPTG